MSYDLETGNNIIDITGVVNSRKPVSDIMNESSRRTISDKLEFSRLESKIDRSNSFNFAMFCVILTCMGIFSVCLFYMGIG